MDEQQEQTSAAVTLFYSYAHEDEHLREQLETHLSLLRRQGLIVEWHDRKIAPGTDWEQAIDTHLMTAQIILLLISPDFLASDYCYGRELHQALKQQEAGGAILIPLLVRPVDWQSASFAHLQYLPRNGKPVTSWRDRDEAFSTVARELRTIIEEIPLTAGSADSSRTFQAPLPLQGPEETAVPRQQARVPRHSIDLNRYRILEQVHKTWIAGVLEHSLHGALFIELGLQSQPDALENRWRLVVQETDQLARPLLAGISIIQVYDETEEALFILREPGAGKTTLLLELARELLSRAQAHKDYPIPIIFNLSSWAGKQQSLDSWLIEELLDKYEVPRKLGSEWVRNDRILLLLDGLDEVSFPVRSPCIQAINHYHREHSHVPIVVCSRSADYFNQPVQLRLHTAVTIQPLTHEQIEQYLAHAGEQAVALEKVLLHDAELLKIATAPLMLNVLMLAYQGVPASEITTSGPLLSRQAQIFASYVQRMLSRRGASTRYTTQQTIHWLSWLGQQLSRHNQTQFYIEHIQKDWLPEKKRRSYQLSLGLLFGGVVGLFVWLIYAIVDGSPYLPSKEIILDFLPTGIFTVIFFFLLYGVVFNWLDRPDARPSRPLASNFNVGIIKKYVAALFKNRIFYGMFVGLFYGWFISTIYDQPLIGALHGFFFGIGYALVGRADTDVQPAEVVTWSWKRARNNFLKYLFIGQFCSFLLILVFGISFLLYFGSLDLLTHNALVPLLLVVATTGLGFGSVFVLIDGISYETLDKDKHITPNQGIHRSVRNSVYLGLASGLLVVLIVALFLGPIWAWMESILLNIEASFVIFVGLAWGVGFGIAIGAVVALRNGGLACLQHVLLRWLLWRSGSIPPNYPHFLDYATERILLRKTGGGYIFIHRLLLEYFAALEPSDQKAPPFSKLLPLSG
jgi:hypothetical protein